MSDSPDAPKLDIVGPTADHDVQRLISRYGKTVFLEAVKRQTKAKRGRKPEKDWLLLQPYLEQDAIDWLEGRDPIKLRSHYAIAQTVAAANPGHNQSATATRILKKLSARRRFLFLADAWHRGEATHPYSVQLRTLAALAEGDETFASLSGYAQADVARYAEMFGEPAQGMTMAEVKKATQNALMQFSPKSGFAGTLGSLFAKAKPKS